MGLISSEEMTGEKVPSKKEIILINERVKGLVGKMDNGLTIERLRYVDSILMQISRVGLLKES